MFNWLLGLLFQTNTLNGILNTFYKIDKKLDKFISKENVNIKVKTDQIDQLYGVIAKKEASITSHHEELHKANTVQENIKKLLNDKL